MKKLKSIRFMLTVLVLAVPIGLSGCGGSVPTPTPTVPPTPTALPTFAPAPVSPAYWPTAGWLNSTPEQQGINSAQLLKALQHISDAGINVRTLTVIRNGYVVLQAANQPFTFNDRYQIMSATKSVIGALVGIAIHEGYIKDVKQPVLSFFPERAIANRDQNKEDLTIEDLLSMQPGLDCADDKIGPVLPQDKDVVQYILDLPMASPPGQTLVYCSAGPHILSAILTKSTGMSTAAYAQSRLFDPMGIAPGDVTWDTDAQGIAIGGYGISMKPDDMAKFGLLYLYGGKWESKQVVPGEWVTASSTVHATGENQKNYGYLFWVYPTHFAAEGLGEQMIQVVKDRNMVVEMTSAIDWHKGPVILKLLQDYIIPAATSDSPMPPNPSALASLQAKVKYMANPVEAVQPLSEVAQRISGKTYLMQDNPPGWKSITAVFEEGNPEAHVTVEATNGETTVTQTVAIGMDNVYRVEQASNGSFVARRGHWTDDHTLVVRQVQLSPDLQEARIQMDFSGDTLKIHADEVIFNTYSYDIQGSVK